MQTTTPIWFYEKNGERKGPISEEEIIQLIRTSVIAHGTSVWRQGYEDWISVEKTDLHIHLDKNPPPLSGSKVNNSVVWVLAFAPIIGHFIEWFLAGLIHGGNELAAQEAMNAGKYWLITPALNIALSVADERLLTKAGYQTNSFKFWAYFLVPVYLYKRSEATKQNIAYFITWMACFALLISE